MIEGCEDVRDNNNNSIIRANSYEVFTMCQALFHLRPFGLLKQINKD